MIENAKAPVAALTMVRGEDFFLKRWLAYYRQFLPDEHIYVLNHGGDPEVAEIALGVNVISLPYDETKRNVNQRRWQILSLFTSGLTQFYNWVICNDVDELVVLDPDHGSNLVDYLMERRAADRVPQALIPFAVEMVHVPEFYRSRVETTSGICKEGKFTLPVAPMPDILAQNEQRPLRPDGKRPAYRNHCHHDEG